MNVEKNGLKNPKRTITTIEIARICGVSRTTVSAVLNGKSTVRESTRKKVLECIRQQNYQFGMIARTLVDELSRMVAVLVSSMGSPYHMMVFRGLSEVLDAEGYHILIHNVRPEDQEDPETLASLHTYRPAGYIVLKGAEGPHAGHARKILELGIPLVAETHFEGMETHAVNFDCRAGMRIGTDYVIEKGHRRVGHIAGPTFSAGAKDRKIGFIESLIAHDIPISGAMIVDGGETAAAGYQAAMEMLRDPARRPTALVCFNDMVAIGVYRAAHELSLDIPGDLSVVGFDGIDFAELFGPPLTSVDIFPTLVGRRAAELLLKAIRNQTGRGFVEEVIHPQLIERASVRSL
ncbi:MAG: LacI family DNA-binding transcriptional regulator [Candidatus Hydrogenedentes bacterium]|nr:LacI family DNA-binding transcriptional regulator [Candidatus Hydrogenedentota bacterium]